MSIHLRTCSTRISTSPSSIFCSTSFFILLTTGRQPRNPPFPAFDKRQSKYLFASTAVKHLFTRRLGFDGTGCTILCRSHVMNSSTTSSVSAGGFFQARSSFFWAASSRGNNILLNKSSIIITHINTYKVTSIVDNNHHHTTNHLLFLIGESVTDFFLTRGSPRFPRPRPARSCSAGGHLAGGALPPA